MIRVIDFAIEQPACTDKTRHSARGLTHDHLHLLTWNELDAMKDNADVVNFTMWSVHRTAKEARSTNWGGLDRGELSHWARECDR